MKNVINLRDMISNGTELTHRQKDDLFGNLAGRCGAVNRARLHTMIYDVSIKTWPAYSIMERVMWRDGVFQYTAGQDYRAEIANIRKILLGET